MWHVYSVQAELLTDFLHTIITNFTATLKLFTTL